MWHRQCSELPELGVLFRGSFAFESFSAWADEKYVKDVTARNRRRTLLQRIGLSLLMVSFALQGIAQFAPG
jgi:hypothetical protein